LGWGLLIFFIMKPKKMSDNESIDKEILLKGSDAINDFDEKEEWVVRPKKKGSKLISIRIP